MVVYGFSVESIGNCCLIAMGRSNGKCQLNYCHWVVPIGDRCSFAFWIASGLNSEGFPSNPEFCFNIVGISQQWLLHPGYFVDTTIACLHVLQWLLLRRRLLIFNIIFINIINVETLSEGSIVALWMSIKSVEWLATSITKLKLQFYIVKQGSVMSSVTSRVNNM